jgi:hypothetical protein
MVFIGALALAFVRSQVTPQAPKTVNDLQTYIQKAPTAVIDKAQVTMPGLSTPPSSSASVGGYRALAIGFVLAAALFGAASAARAEAPPLLSLDRLSAGPRALAQVYIFDADKPREIGWIAGGAASYSLTSRWDANASVERKFNAGTNVPTHWRYSTGLDVLLPNSNSKQQWFLAVERAWYVAPGYKSPGNWVVRLQWAFGAQDKEGRDYAFAIARGRYDVDLQEDAGGPRKDFGFGIQPQLIGGH